MFNREENLIYINMSLRPLNCLLKKKAIALVTGKLAGTVLLVGVNLKHQQFIVVFVVGRLFV